MTGETVYRLRAATSTDDYGDEVGGTDAETRFTGVAVAPRYAREVTDNRSASIVGLTLYFPAGTDTDDVRPTDRWRVRGLDYEADGEPGEWINPYTSTHHGLEVAVKRTTG